MTYRIGDLARTFGVTLRTLRFYEDRGLIRPERNGTTRLYDEAQKKRIDIILFCKRIGLTLDDVRAVLALHDAQDGEDAAQRRDRLAMIYRAQLEGLHARQEETRRTIDELTERLSGLTGRDAPRGKPAPRRAAMAERRPA